MLALTEAGKKLKREFNEKVENYFRGLSFVASTHSYFVGSQKVPSSVSGLLKKFEGHTDWDAIAANISRRDGVPKEEVLDNWKRKNTIACNNGTKTHTFAEDYTDGKSVLPTCGKDQAVIKFWDEVPDRYILVGNEIRMYHKQFFYSGTSDITLYDTYTGHYIIADYKTNEDLFKNYKDKRLNAPFQNLLDTPYSHYELQLSFYQLMFEQMGYIVDERWIIYLLPDGTYLRYKCNNFTKKLAAWLTNNYRLD